MKGSKYQFPVIHIKGAGVGGAIAKSSGGFFFIWTLLALGVTALFSVILCAGGLWGSCDRRRQRSKNKVPLLWERGRKL